MRAAGPRLVKCRCAGGAAGSCTVTRSPPAARGVRVSVPSCACVMLLTSGRARDYTRVVGADAFGAAKKRLDKRGDRLWGELLAGALDREHHVLGVNAGRDPHGAVFGQVVDDCVLHEVRRQLQQERV